MARIVTLQLLVDCADDSETADCLHEIFRPLQRALQEEGCEAKSAFIDYKIVDGNGEIYASPVSPEIEDAITNETYSEGDAFAGPNHSMVLANGKSYGLGAQSIWINVPKARGSAEGVALYIKRDLHGLDIEAYLIHHEMDSDIGALRVDFEDETTPIG